MITTYKFMMKPSASQEEFFAKCFGCARFVYNHALNEKMGAYSSGKKSLSFFDLCAEIRQLRRRSEYGWLNDVPAITLNYSLLNLDNAYKRFFKTKGGFPKFKSKKHSRNAVKFDPSSVKYDFEDFRVRIPQRGGKGPDGARVDLPAVRRAPRPRRQRCRQHQVDGIETVF